MTPNDDHDPENSSASESTRAEADGGRPSRRQVIFAGAAVGASVAGWSWLMPSLAAPLAPLPAAVALTPEASAFLAFSKAITGHADLSAETARRIHEAMSAAAPDFGGQSTRLAGLVAAVAAIEPKALLESATAAGLRETALAIVAAWYTGTIGSGTTTKVVSYAKALMYQPVRDGQTVPTYCNYGPAWWTRDPPAIGVSAPVEKAAAPAPTTGNPMPYDAAPMAPRTTPQGAPK